MSYFLFLEVMIRILSCKKLEKFNKDINVIPNNMEKIYGFYDWQKSNIYRFFSIYYEPKFV